MQAFDYVIKEQRTLLLTFAGRMTEEFDIRQERYRGNDGEREVENKLRPLTFDSFSGQDKVVENLSIFVAAARLRGEALDHTLLHGPPGLGKTTLSNIIANELGVGLKSLPVPSSTSRVIWPDSSLRWNPTMYFS